MFRCKQFNINDNGATMKIGNDAIMLGAIAQPSLLPQHILDIGTGCGILALMMAQRFPIANITAIDIDRQTIQVAAANFENSPWSNRLYALNVPLQDFATKSDRQYDLIISNPPYFTNSLRNNDPRKALARHDDNLTLQQLFKASSHLLAPDGTLAIIIPSSDAEKAITEAQQRQLQCRLRTDICNHLSDPPKRSVLQFIHSTSPTEPTITSLPLRNPDNTYSDEYKTLTQPFLL